MKPENAFMRYAVLACILLVPGALSWGATVTWTGNTDANWATSGNWAGSMLPSASTPGDNIVFHDIPGTHLSTNNNRTNHVTGIILNNTGSGTITIAGNTYMLYSGGIDMSSSSKNLIITAAMNVELQNTTTFNVAGGRTLTWSGGGDLHESDARLVITGGGSTVISGALTGWGGIDKNGNGSLTLSGNNSFRDGVTISAGTLNLNSNTAPGISTSRLIISGGTIDNTSGSSRTLTNNNVQTWSGYFTFAGSNDLNLGTGAVTLTASPTVTVSSGTLTVGGVISESDGTRGITKAGGGTLVISNTNTYTGATTVSAGTLTLTGSTAAGSAVTVNNTGTLTGTGLINGSLTVNSGGTVDPGVGATPGRLRVNGAVSFAAGSTYRVRITGNNINDTLVVGGSASCNLGSATLSLDLAYAPSIGQTFRIVDKTSSGAITGTFIGLAEGAQTTALFGGTTYAFTINYGGGDGNDVVLTCGSTKEWTGGGGNDSWSNSDNWSGGVPISNDLILFNTQSLARLATGVNDLTLSGASLHFTNPSADMTISGNPIGLAAGSGINMSGASRNVRINNNLTFSGNQTWEVAGGFTLHVAGNTSGTQSITKSGAGALTLSGSNAHSGGTILTAGTLRINSATALGSGVITFANGTTIDNTSAGAITLSTNNAQTWAGSFTFTGTRDLNLGTGAVTLSASPTITVGNGILTVGGAVSGAYNLTKAGAGTLLLSGDNAYSGTTTISAGTLRIGAAERIPNASALTLSNTSGAVLNLNGFNETIGSLAGGGASGGNVTLGSATLTCGQNNSSTTYSGVISGAGGLTKTGTGVLTISGANTYTGQTTINAGTLSITGSTAAGSAVVVNNTGTLTGTGIVNGALTVNSGGTVDPGVGATAGRLRVNGAVAFAAGSTCRVRIAGNNINDTLVVGSSASCNLGSATLNLDLAYAPSEGHTYRIVDNTSTGAITGTFNGLAEGARISTSFGGTTYRFIVSYVGGDGNDVVLTYEFVPPSGSLSISDLNGFTNRLDPPLIITSVGADSVRIGIVGGDSSVWKPVTSSPMTDSISAAGQGTTVFWVRFKNQAGNVSGRVLDTTTIDITPPTSTISTSGTFSKAGWTGISGTAYDSLSGIAQVQLQVRRSADLSWWTGTSWSGSSGWVNATTQGGSWNYPMPAAHLDEGQYTIATRAIDRAGNVQSPSTSGGFTIDNTYAGTAQITIAKTNGFTNDPDPRLTLTSPTAVSMKIAQTADTGAAAWKPFAPADSINISAGGDREVRIWARFRDAIGNLSPWVSDVVTYDATRPVSEVGTRGVFNAATWPGVVGGTASDGGSGVAFVDVQIRNTTDNTWWNGSGWDTVAVWHRANGTATWSLSIGSQLIKEGRYTVQSRATDAAGNVQSAPTSGTFSYDNTPPRNVRVIITDRDGFTADSRPPLTITATGADSMRFEYGAEQTGWLRFSSTHSIDLGAGGDGPRIVQVQCKDTAGNLSSWAADTTVLDRTAPFAVVTTTGSFNTATWRGINGTATDAGSGVDSVYVSVRNQGTNLYWDGSGWSAVEVWHPASGNASWTFAIPAASLAEARYSVTARGVDKVGNRQGDALPSEFVFHTPPRARFSPAAPLTVRPGELIAFSDSSTGTISSRLWNFGDGTTSTDQNPQKAYQDTGKTFTVSLIVTGPGGSDTLRRENLVFVGAGNPVRLTGRYLSDTTVQITYGSLDRIPTPDNPVLRVDSLLVRIRAGALPENGSTVIARHRIAAVPKPTFMDTISVSRLTLPDSIYGFMAMLKLSDGSLMSSSAANGALVLMRDTVRVVNKLRLFASYLGGDSVRVTVDSTHLLDRILAKRVGIWYGTGDPAVFSAPPTLWIAAADSVWSRVIRDPLFAGESRTLLLRLTVEGNNGLLSRDTSKTSITVGRSRPVNTAILSAEAIGPDRIRLSWSGAQNADSIRIWYGREPVPVNTLTIPSSFSAFVLPGTQTVDTVKQLVPDTRYHFGLQIARDGLWSFVTPQASATDVTEKGDSTGIANTILILSAVFDSITNRISIVWTVPSAIVGVTEFGITSGLGAFSAQPPLRWEPVTDTQTTTILDLRNTIVFDTLYCISVWLRRPAGIPARPGDSSTVTVRTPRSFTWQEIVYFDPHRDRDTVAAFNGTVVWWKDSTYQLEATTTDTLRAFVPGIASLDGFVVVGTGFSVAHPEPLPPVQIGIRYAPALLSGAISARAIRIYRFVDGEWMVERGTVIDTVNRIAYIRTNNLAAPFIAMVDTVAPVWRIIGDIGSPVDPQLQTTINDSIGIRDNTANVRWQLLYGRGSERPGSSTGAVLAEKLDTVRTTVPSLGIENSGLRIRLIVDDGVHTDTIDLSRRGIRHRSDETVVPQLDWHPLHVTAHPDSATLQGLFGREWSYDSMQMRLMRWYPHPGNEASPDKWVEYGPDRDSIFAFTPGAVVWIKTRERRSIGFGRATTVSLTDTVSLTLPPGEWSDIAVPFGFDVYLRDILNATGPRSDLLTLYSWVKQRLRSGDSAYVSRAIYSDAIVSLRDYRDSLILESHPEVSYTIFNHSDSAVELRIPPVCLAMSAQPRGRAKTASPDAWSAVVSLETMEGTVLTPVYCGYSPGKGAMTILPSAPSFLPLRLGISAGDGAAPASGAVIVHRSERGYAFRVTTSNGGQTGEKLRLRLDGTLPRGMQAMLFNPIEERWENDSSAFFSLAPGERDYRYVVVGDAEYRAGFTAQVQQWRLALVGVHPNPFAGKMMIRYSVPYTSVKEIRFGIYDMLGRCYWSHTRHHPMPGIGTVAWEAPAGRRLAGAGVYILRMSAVEQGKTRIFKQRITYMPR